MISHKEAQELHELVGWLRQYAIDNGFDDATSDKDADRALELAALIVSDTDMEA